MLVTNQACNLDPIDSNLTLSVADKTFLKSLLNPDTDQRLTAEQALRHEWFDELKEYPPSPNKVLSSCIDQTRELLSPSKPRELKPLVLN